MKEPRNAPPRPTTAAELEGFVGLGMKSEALRLARRHLKSKSINPCIFCAAVNAILTLADATKPWRPLVEDAYQKLSKRGKREARFMMLSFFVSLDDNEAAYRFIPRHFGEPVDPVELMLSIEVLLALGRIEEAGSLVRKAIRILDTLLSPEGRAMLMSCIASYLTQHHEWESAIRLWEELRQDHLMFESSIFGLVDLHIHRTLATIRSARVSLDHFRQHPDPELETTIPGNDDARWREAEAKLRKIEHRVIQALAAAGCNHHTAS